MRESNGLDATSSEAASERPRTGRATLPSRAVRRGAAAAGVTATAQHNSPAAPHDLRLSAQLKSRL